MLDTIVRDIEYALRSLIRRPVVTTVAVLSLGLGCAAALALGRLAESLLFGVRVTPPLVMVGSMVGVFVVTVMAAVLPASRAVRVDPAMTLRAE